MSVGVAAGTPAPGKSLSAGLSGVGIGSDSGSASSTSTAGISGVAGDLGARTGDKEAGLASPIGISSECKRHACEWPPSAILPSSATSPWEPHMACHALLIRMVPPLNVVGRCSGGLGRMMPL